MLEYGSSYVTLYNICESQKATKENYGNTKKRTYREQTV